jgi:putative hydrolase of the HAD superfamily
LSNEVGLLKPDPAIYRLALEQLNVPAHRAIFIDDVAEMVAGATAVDLAGVHHKRWPATQAAIESWLADR